MIGPAEVTKAPTTMSNDTIILCGCCNADTEAAKAIFDSELSAHVCPECRRDLTRAQGQLARSFSAPANGVPSMPINMRGAYKGEDAPDNA